MNAGYLDRNQLAFVYRLVCAMRNIPCSEYTEGLNSEALRSIHFCDKSFGHYYGSQLHDPNKAQKLAKIFNNAIVTLQRELAELDKNLTYIKKSYCETMDCFLIKGHKKLRSMGQKITSMTEKIEPDPALNFLNAIDRKFELDRMDEELSAISRDTRNLLKKSSAMGRHLYQSSKRFPDPASNMFNIVTCRQDGTKLRLPEQSGNLIVKCPTCKYQFAYNTTFKPFSYFQMPQIIKWLVQGSGIV